MRRWQNEKSLRCFSARRSKIEVCKLCLWPAALPHHAASSSPDSSSAPLLMIPTQGSINMRRLPSLHTQNRSIASRSPRTAKRCTGIVTAEAEASSNGKCTRIAAAEAARPLTSSAVSSRLPSAPLALPGHPSAPPRSRPSPRQPRYSSTPWSMCCRAQRSQP